jgi:hypothetical protein
MRLVVPNEDEELPGCNRKPKPAAAAAAAAAAEAAVAAAAAAFEGSCKVFNCFSNDFFDCCSSFNCRSMAFC